MIVEANMLSATANNGRLKKMSVVWPSFRKKKKTSSKTIREEKLVPNIVVLNGSW